MTDFEGNCEKQKRDLGDPLLSFSLSPSKKNSALRLLRRRQRCSYYASFWIKALSHNSFHFFCLGSQSPWISALPAIWPKLQNNNNTAEIMIYPGHNNPSLPKWKQWATFYKSQPLHKGFLKLSISTGCPLNFDITAQKREEGVME